jgi:phosphopantothenoylcysteine synthetase/decarboxylase
MLAEDRPGNGAAPAEHPLTGRNVLIGVTGSIAAVMVGPGILWLRQNVRIGGVRAVMTAQAAQLVPPRTISKVCGIPAVAGWEDVGETEVAHLLLTEWADLFVVVPATANMLAKVASGVADDIVSTCVLAAECPVVLAPAMNRAMWQKRATRRNVAQLRADGYALVEPVEGYAVASGTNAAGAMADIPTVMDAAARVFQATGERVAEVRP